MQKGGFYNTGATGASFTVFNVIYIIGLILYYSTSLSFTQDIPTSSILGIFILWSTLKPLVPLFSAIWGALQITNIFLAFILVVMIGGVWVGTIGLGAKLLIDMVTTCNTVKDFNNLCNDLKYCCVYHDQVPSCAGFGPCLGPDDPQTPEELTKNPDFLLLLGFTGFFFFMELILIVLSFMTYRVRERQKRDRQILYNQFTDKAFNNINSAIGNDDNVDDDKKNYSNKSSSSSSLLAPSWYDIIAHFDDAIDGCIPHVVSINKHGLEITYARKYYDGAPVRTTATTTTTEKIKTRRRRKEKRKVRKENVNHNSNKTPGIDSKRRDMYGTINKNDPITQQNRIDTPSKLVHRKQAKNHNFKPVIPTGIRPSP